MTVTAELGPAGHQAPPHVRRRDPSGGALPPADDTRIAAGLRDRDVGALTEAYRRHGSQVMAAVRRHSVGSGDAEDIVQEVFLRLWQRPADFDPSRGSLLTFMLAMARYRAIDRLRSERARARRQGRESPMVGEVEDVVQKVEAE